MGTVQCTEGLRVLKISVHEPVPGNCTPVKNCSFFVFVVVSCQAGAVILRIFRKQDLTILALI